MAKRKIKREYPEILLKKKRKKQTYSEKENDYQSIEIQGKRERIKEKKGCKISYRK